MSLRLSRFFLPLCPCFALIALLTPPAFAAPRYSVTDLGILPGGKYVYVTGINNLGQVVGWVKAAHTRTRGFLWTGTMHDLGTIPNFRNCKAFGINDHSQIVGQDRTDQVGPMYAFSGHSFIWKDGQKTALPNVNTNQGSIIGEDMAATAINNLGQVVGSTGYLWQHNGTIRIGTSAAGINDLGQIACEKLVSYASGTPGAIGGASGSHPILWKDGTATDLGLMPGAEFAEVSGINAVGQVVGWMDSFMSASGNIDEYSFFWNGSRYIKIGSFKGYRFSQAYGINAQGQVVGKCVRHRGYAHAYCWHNGNMKDLNSFIPKHTGWILEAAYDINNRGRIIGVGTHGRNHFRSFLLTPKD